MAEYVHASAAVGAFLVGLTLTGETAERARRVLGPLRDLFAAIFFLGVGLSVAPEHLLPMLPVAVALATVTAITKVATVLLTARREFSLIIIGLVGSTITGVTALATSYVFVVAIVGPLVTRFTGGPVPVAARTPS